MLLAAIEAERHLSGSTLQDMRALVGRETELVPASCHFVSHLTFVCNSVCVGRAVYP